MASDTTTRHLAAEDVHTRILLGIGAAALLLENDVRRGIALRFLGSWVGTELALRCSMFLTAKALFRCTDANYSVLQRREAVKCYGKPARSPNSP